MNLPPSVCADHAQRLHPIFVSVLAAWAPPPAANLRPLCGETLGLIEEILEADDYRCSTGYLSQREILAHNHEISIVSELLGEPIVHRVGGGRTYSDVVSEFLEIARPEVAGSWEMLECILNGDEIVQAWASKARTEVSR